LYAALDRPIERSVQPFVVGGGVSLWIWMLLAVAAIWVFVDARKRKADQPGLWAIGTFLIAVLAFPAYLTTRPLLPGGRREGGRGWNFLRYLALMWTVLMAVLTVMYLVSIADTSAGLHSDAERAGAAIGTALGIGLIGVIWLAPTAVVLLIGVLVRKQNEVETGDTTSPSPISTATLERRRCPYCAEEIQAAAVICRFCQRDVRGGGVKP
jgi:hypothetical protein